MLRTRSNPSTSNPNLTPGPTAHHEPDTPSAHYDNRTHQHAQPENEIDPLEVQARRMSAPSEGIASRRGSKGMILNGLSKLQNLGSGGKGKGKAQYRLGMCLRQRVDEYKLIRKGYHIEHGYWLQSS